MENTWAVKESDTIWGKNKSEKIDLLESKEL